MKLMTPLSEPSLLQVRNDNSSRLLEEMELRMQGPMTPNSELGFNVRHVKRFSRVRSLSILSWLLGPTGFLLREDIRSYCISQFTGERRIEIELLLHSVTAAERYCVLSFSERDWYGNQIPLLKNELSSLQLRTFKTAPGKHQERIRGYRDHGTLRPSHKWLERFDFSFTEEQARIDRERQFFQDSVRSLITYLEQVDTSKVDTSLKEMIKETWKERLEDYLISL